MPRRPLVERADLAHMLRDRKLTYREVAEETGLTVSGVKQAARRYGLQDRTPRLDHSWAVPWTVKVEHQDSKVVKYLRHLSRVAQGGQPDRYETETVLRWADQKVDLGLDVDYDPDVEPNDDSIQGGFYLRPADSDWHLKKVRDRARARILKGR